MQVLLTSVNEKFGLCKENTVSHDDTVESVYKGGPARFFVHTEETYLSVEASNMATLKFAEFILLVYFTTFATARNRFCKKADQKLGDLKALIENMDCSGQGKTPFFCFYLISSLFLGLYY